LGSGDVKPSGYDHTTMISAEIGDCITEIQAYTFFNFTSLSSVTISENVTDIGTRGFYGCSGLVDINLPSGLTSINDNVFQNCSNLSSISIPNTITSIGAGAFQNCSSLTNIELPSGITSIGGGAFAGCESLSSIIVNAVTPPALGGDLVFWNTNDCPIYVPCQSVDIYKAAEYWSDYASRIEAIPYSCFKLVYTADGNTYSIDCDDTTVLGENYEVTRNVSNNGAKVSGVTDAIIGTCVESIYPNTFNRFTNLSSVTLTENVTTIGASAFDQCYNLSRINLPQSLTTIGGTAFENCWNLSAVTIPSGVTRIEVETFEHCNRLRTIILPSTIEYIGQFAFSIQDSSDATEKAAKIETARSRVIYIYATTPPEISSADVFESHIPNVPATYPIYVPTQSVEAYRTAEHWKDMNDVTRIQAMP
jgi:hypothetical protein